MSILCPVCNTTFTQELRDLSDMNVLLLMIDGSAAFGRLTFPSNRGVVRLVQPVGANFPTGYSNAVVFHPANNVVERPALLAQTLIDICDIAFVIWGTFPCVPLFNCEEDDDDDDCPTNDEEDLGATLSNAGYMNNSEEYTHNCHKCKHKGKYNFNYGREEDEESETDNTRVNNNNNSSACNSPALFSDLSQLVVRNIGLQTLGGWVVFGQLGQVDECVALIAPATATIPFVTVQGTLTLSGPGISTGYLTLPSSVSAWTNLAALTQILQP